MRAKVAALISLLLFASHAGAQTPEPGAARSPQLQEAERLSAEVVRLYGAGEFEEALPLAAQALALREKELGPADSLVGVSLVNLASVELRLGKRDEAKGHFRRAVAVLEKLGDVSPQSLISAHEGLALLGDGAVEHYKRALALREKAYGADSPELLDILFQLGRYTDSVRGSAEAERYFRRFAEIGEKTKAVPADAVAVAYLRIECIMEKKDKRGEADAARIRAGTAIEDAGVINDRVISKPQPMYPASAKAARAQGTVEVEVVVSETGAVLVACARGNADRILKEESERIAHRAQFIPASVNGKPVKVRGIITYKFILK